MVDARLPAEWLGSIRIDNLTDRAFRILAGALMWCNGQGTDGEIPTRYTRYLHPDGDDQAAFDELEQAGIWTRDADGYLLTGWSSELRQSTAEEVRRYKEAARLRQKAYRERRRSDSSAAAFRPAKSARATHYVAHDVTRDVTTNVGSGSLGDDRKEERAYVTRDVSRHATSPFCPKHPTGTTTPCGACARARVALEAQQSTLPGLGWDCAVDGHKFVRDGTCAVCEFRPNHCTD